MKRAKLKVTLKLLENVLQLSKCNVEIAFVEQDMDNRFSKTCFLELVGKGLPNKCEMIEGALPLQVQIGELLPNKEKK